MTFPIFALMIIAGALAVYGLLQERRGAGWGRPLAMVAASAVLVMALFTMFSGERGPDAEDMRRTQKRYQELAGEKVGRFLAQNYPGQNVVFLGGFDYSPITAELGEEYMPYNRAWEVYLSGLKKGMGNNQVLVDVVQLPLPEGAIRMIDEVKAYAGDADVDMYDIMMGLESMYFTDSARAYNKALQPYLRKTDIVVLFKWPYDSESLDLWRIQSPPKLVILSPQNMLPTLKNAIAKGDVIGTVTNRPGYEFEDRSIPGDLDEAFDKRFLFITPDNLAEIAAEYKNLFLE